MFLFSVRMHERYMYPALALLLFCCLYKPRRLSGNASVGFAALHFYNTANVLYHYDPQNYDRKAPIILLVSAGMLCCLYDFYKIIWKYYVHGEAVTDAKPQPTIGRRASGHTLPQISRTRTKTSEYFSLLPWSPFLLRRIHFTRTGPVSVADNRYSLQFFALYDWETAKAPETTTYDMSQNYRSLSWNFPKIQLL